MYKQVSIHTAIKKRKRIMLLRLPFFLLVGAIAGLVWTLKINLLPGVLSGPLIGVIAAYVTYLVCKLYFVPKWFIWAFTHVDNMYELYRAAETADVMLPEDSWTAEYAIVSKAGRQKMQAIYRKLNESIHSSITQVVADDNTVPQQTAIYTSTPKIIILSIAIVLCGSAAASALFIGLFSFLVPKESSLPPLLNDNPWLMFVPGVVVSIFAAIVFLRFNGVLGEKKPQIIISAKGISTAQHGFTHWDSIKNEKVKLISGGKNAVYVLTYEYPGGIAEIDLTKLKIDQIELNHLLSVYRIRSNPTA